MPKVSRLPLVVAGLLLAGAPVMAQQTPTRVRGKIEAMDGSNLTIKARDGADVKVHLLDKPRITALEKATLDDVKPDSYIGVVSAAGADGEQHATSIHIFPEAMRGTGEGQRPWDTGPKNLMTNAAVRSKVASRDGQTLVLNARDEDKKIIVDASTPIVRFVPGTSDDLKVGAEVIVLNATKTNDGLESAAVNVGRGLRPAM